VSSGDEDHEAAGTHSGAAFIVLQMLFTGGADVSYVATSQRWVFAIIMVVGVIIMSIFIGLITDSMMEYMDGLKMGKSDVIEHGHVLVLGHSDKLMGLILQLSKANESEGGGVVVVLSELSTKQEVRSTTSCKQAVWSS
jgi:hypothetical protein